MNCNREEGGMGGRIAHRLAALWDHGCGNRRVLSHWSPPENECRSVVSRRSEVQSSKMQCRSGPVREGQPFCCPRRESQYDESPLAIELWIHEKLLARGLLAVAREHARIEDSGERGSLV